MKQLLFTLMHPVRAWRRYRVNSGKMPMPFMYPSVDCVHGQWCCSGVHFDGGAGILSYHMLQRQAEYNAKVINQYGGRAYTEPNLHDERFISPEYFA